MKKQADYADTVRIMYVITGLSTGGAEKMLLKLLERLDKSRFAPMVVSLTTMGEIGMQIKSLGIPVKALEIISLKSAIKGLQRLIKHIKLHRPDIVHTWLYHADLLGGVAARFAGVPTVCWGIHSDDLDKTRWTTRAIQRICALLSHTIPTQIFQVSRAGQALHIRLGYSAKKMLVIPNGFDLSRFKPNDEARKAICHQLGLPDDTMLIGMVARLDPLKNNYGVIEVMRLLHVQMPRVHLLLAGQGIDRSNSELVGLIAKYALDDHIHLLGPSSDIPLLMGALDVLISPSHAEAFPNVLGEAMACAVPCVVTNVGDCAYIVGDTGQVVAKGDMAALATAVESLLCLPARKRALLGEMARKRVETYFEIDGIVRNYEDSYASLYRKSCREQ